MEEYVGRRETEMYESVRFLFNDFYPETPMTCTWDFQNGFSIAEIGEIVWIVSEWWYPPNYEFSVHFPYFLKNVLPLRNKAVLT